ncbi:MAG: MaoC family dehydratase N-terminal domain-containing protein [Candidatus Rokubacteria bacterium]|nr:MaoC family dehydratase N-terminal domain-containing protein [Candidatus Rokubacteria bacterium]
MFYFEDVVVGDPLETPGRTLTEADIVQYVGLTGEWEPPTTDEVAASRTETGGRVIPDLLPLCMSSGLGWRVPQPPLAVLAFMGFEWKFSLPLRIGDTIRSRSRTVAKRSMKDGGVVVEEREILNQRGEVVQSGRLTVLVAKRPPK